LKTVLKVRRKGIVILPKRLREEAGIREGDDLLAEAINGRIILKSLKPTVVDVDLELVEKLLGEEYRLEAEKYGGILEANNRKEASP